MEARAPPSPLSHLHQQRVPPPPQSPQSKWVKHTHLITVFRLRSHPEFFLKLICASHLMNVVAQHQTFLRLIKTELGKLCSQLIYSVIDGRGFMSRDAIFHRSRFIFLWSGCTEIFKGSGLGYGAIAFDLDLLIYSRW